MVITIIKINLSIAIDSEPKIRWCQEKGQKNCVRKGSSFTFSTLLFRQQPIHFIFQPKNKKIAEILTTMQFLSIFTETQTIQFFFLLLLIPLPCWMQYCFMAVANTTRWQNAMHSISTLSFSVRLSAPPREKWVKNENKIVFVLCGVQITFNIFLQRLPNRTAKNFFFCSRRIC